MTQVYQTEFDVPDADTGIRAGMSIEDGGQAIICDVDPGERGDEDSGFFVRLHSWHEGAKKTDSDSHPTMRSLMGKRVRVTVEVMEDALGSPISN